MPSKAVQRDNEWFATPRGQRYKRARMALAQLNFDSMTAKAYIWSAMSPSGIPSMAKKVRSLRRANSKKPLNMKEAEELCATIESMQAELVECLILSGQILSAAKVRRHGQDEKP